MTTIPIACRVSDDGSAFSEMAQDELARQMKGLAGKDAEIVLRARQRRRNLQQNALYWSAYVAPISEWTGYTPLETHELLKRLFLPESEVKHLVVCDTQGEVIVEDDIPVDRSTTQLNTKEFSAYLDAIARWAGEKLDMEIPGEQRERAS